MGATDAEQCLLDNMLAAEGIAKSILREEIGAACFNAHAHILLGCTGFCQLDAQSWKNLALLRRENYPRV
jgi:hypothetical protein